jgi:hypothetical protein
VILEMTASALLSYGAPASQGFSETARLVEELAGAGRRHLDNSFTFGLRDHGSYEALFSISEECREANWDGYGAEAVSVAAYRLAYRFLESLPLGVPAPSVGAEADGHLTLEWYRSTDRLLSVSIGPEGVVYYAALLGASKRSGTEPFHGEVPDDIVRIIRRLFAA